MSHLFVSLCAGTYGNVSGLSVCFGCHPGSFFNGVSATQCSSAPVGSFVSQSSQTVPEQCGAGTFSNQLAVSTCSNCGLGHFSVRGSSSCQPCPVGTFSGTNSSGTCSPCYPGTYNNDTAATACHACAQGTFQIASGQVSCVPCAAGSYTPASSSHGYSFCIACPIGTATSSLGSSSCQACSPGTFQNDTGTSVCQTCSAGTFTRTALSTTCAVCSAGKFAPPQSTTCHSCGAGFFSANDQSGTCTPCLMGTSSFPSSSQCISCNAGSFAPTTGSLCLLCPPGFYSNTLAATSCIACPAAYAALSSGSLACTKCPRGTYSDALNASTCAVCPVGMYTDPVGGTHCKTCTSGSVPSTNASLITGNMSLADPNCFICPVGTFSVMPAAVCTSCPTGLYSSAEASACLVCPDAMTANEDGSGCTDAFTVKAFHFLVSAGFLGACLLILIVITIGILCIRKERSVAMASPTFLCTILIGVFSLNGTAFLFIWPQTPFLCTTKFWLLYLGIDLVFGSMFAKTWRLHRIFNNEQLSNVQITDTTLFCYMLPLFAYDIVVLTTWVVVAPFQLQSPLILHCLSNYQHVSFLWHGLLFGPKIVLLGALLWIAYQVRKIDSLYNESRVISFSVYTVLMVAAGLLVLVLSGTNSTMSFFLASIAVALGFASTTVGLFMITPKFYYFLKQKGMSQEDMLKQLGLDSKASSISRQSTIARKSPEKGPTAAKATMSSSIQDKIRAKLKTNTAEFVKVQRNFVCMFSFECCC
jgi:hypothetical protein